MIEELDPVSVAQALIRCPSVTPEEGGALTYLQARLEAMGFVCQRLVFSESGTPDVDNLFARFGTGAPHLCFAGHTDVVPPGDEALWTHPPFAAEIADGVLYGRGAVDMKGAIACFVAAVSRVLKANPEPNGSISLLITGDEEGPSINGTEKVLRWMADNGHIPDLCIVGEPTNPKRIGDMLKIGRRGCISGRLTVHGKRGHVAYAHLANNPVHGICRVIKEIADLTLDGKTDYFDPSNLEFTTVEVNNKTDNVIPEAASAIFNIRFNDQQSGASLEKLLNETAARVLDGSGLTFAIQMGRCNDPFITEPGAEVVAFEAVVREVTGLMPERSTSGGTSDARFVRQYCPVFEFGLVNATIHQIDERTATADIVATTDIYEGFIRRYLVIV